MALATAAKQAVIKEYQLKEHDTGSPEVQIALYTTRITQLTDHITKFKKDLHTRRGLLNLVSKRRRLLNYLKREDHKRYSDLIKRLDIRR
jgi:small subunit ribosomal protein S15